MTDVPSRGGIAGTYLTTSYSFGRPYFGASQGQGAAWFGPATPMAPSAPPDVAGRQWDYPAGFNLSTQPRSGETIKFADLREIADGYDLLRTVIETRKDQLARMSWSIKNRDTGASDDTDPRVKALTSFFRRPDGFHGWGDWLRMVLEDLFVIDAPSLYMQRDRGGRLIQLIPLDGATIKPIIDPWGRTPQPYSDGSAMVYPSAYQQVLKGLPAVDYSTRDLLYRPRNRRTHSAYGMSAVEQIVTTVNIALRRQLSTLSYFTEGNIPDMIVQVPKEWTPDQVAAFQKHWDSYFSGDIGRRRRAKFTPGVGQGGIHETRQVDLKGDFDEWLAKLVCFAFSISPQALTRQMNRASADTQKELAEEEGLEPILLWIKSWIDDILAFEFGADDLEFDWDDDDEVDEAQKLNVITGYTSKGLMTIDEGRQQMGLDPFKTSESQVPMVLVQTGYVPLGAWQQQQDAAAEQAKVMAEATAQQPQVAPPVDEEAPQARNTAEARGAAQRQTRETADVGKAFNPSQPRDEDGKWTATGGAGGSSTSSDDWSQVKSIAKSVAIGAGLTAAAAVASFLAPEIFAVAGGLAAGEAAVAAGATAREAVSAATTAGRLAWVTEGVTRVAHSMYLSGGLKAGKLILQHLGVDTTAAEEKLRSLQEAYDNITKSTAADTISRSKLIAALADIADQSRDSLVQHLAHYQDAESYDTAIEAIDKARDSYKGDLRSELGKSYTLGKKTWGGYRRPDPVPFDRPATRRAEKGITNRLAEALATLARRARTDLQDSLGKMTKAELEEPEDRARRISDEFSSEFDMSALQDVAGPVADDLEDVTSDSVSRSVAQIGPDDASGLVNQVNPRAVDAARSRAAEMVGMRWDADGNLVPSSNPDMAITETTRDELRQTIADGLARSLSADDIAEEIAKSYAFSPERAALIAATEVSRANSEAALASYQVAADLGIVIRKVWLAEADCCDVCSGNQAAGPIALDAEFPSGDDTPPGHPNCRCSLSPVVGDEPAEKAFNPNQARDARGRWASSSMGDVLAAAKAKSDPIRHTIGRVRRATTLSRIAGVHLDGFRHTIGSQGVAHVLRQHGSAKTEASRGQIAVKDSDFGLVGEIVGEPDQTVAGQAPGRGGQPRIAFEKSIEGVKYTYVGEVQAGKRRIEMVTMWKK